MKLKTRMLAPFAKARPWRRRRPRPAGREVAILDRPPLAQINIYDECVILTRRRPDGTWSSYPVAPDALGQVLGRLPVSTGLLPTGTLATGTHRGKPFVVQLLRPRHARLQVEEAGVLRTVTLTTPPLIWAGWDREYRIWAALLPEGAAPTPQTRLGLAPFPNVYASGGICWGNVTRPRPAAPAEMEPSFRLFLEESVFNQHIAGGKSKAFPASILRRYDTLDPEQGYPLDDLVPVTLSLRQVLDGSVWGML